ncbi:MAG: FAD-linked oxidase C-terminal domain-containing protein [Candidatus Eisenbacteria bacterium]
MSKANGAGAGDVQPVRWRPYTIACYTPPGMKTKPFVDHLRSRVRGRVFADVMRRGLYATDASIYQVLPVAVAVPVDAEDVRAAVRTAAEHRVPVVPRGAGTSLGGQVAGTALVLDISKHFRRVLEVNAEERWARVEPGVVRDELNVLVAPHGLHFAPDPATTNRATIGGMIGNNASGMRSVRYGMTLHHVDETLALLAEDSVLRFRELGPDERERLARVGGPEGRILDGLGRIVESRRDAIASRFPKVMRRVGGYNLDAFASSDRWNLSNLMVGSEGTLAVLLEARVRLEPLPKAVVLCVPEFESLGAALKAVPEILADEPTAVEILDRILLREARGNVSTAPLCGFLEGDPEAVLLVEFSGDDARETLDRTRRFAREIVRRGDAFSAPVIEERAAQARAWEVRRAGLGLAQAIPGNRKPVPFIEDACVPVEHLADYIDEILRLCEERGTYAVTYGHASVGVLHIKPVLDLRVPHDLEYMKEISRAAFDLVRGYGGSWSGEHGDGLIRSAYLEEFFGSEVYGAFRDVKDLFDPLHVLNPGKIVDAPPMDSNLRYGPSYAPVAPRTFYHYRAAGGFLAAVELCNGVGACRKTLTGTMCPSYIATRDEEHSTRGRANALRLALAGELGSAGLATEALGEVLDLCLSCKACRSECPSNVDVARLKAEFRQAYRDAHGGVSIRDRLVALSPRLAALAAGPAAPLVNAVQRSSLFRHLLEKTAGFDRRRLLPDYARRPFHGRFRPSPRRNEARTVVLFDDTYMNFHEPEVGVATADLLESCGYEVILARAGCCQRPRLSHGFLREAKRDGEKTLRRLDCFIRDGLPVVVCEPGCASALTDDLPDLMDDEELARRIEGNVVPIEVFLDREIREGRLDVRLLTRESRIVLHGHCHQKALHGTAPLLRIFSMVEGLRVEEIDSGCCGMAGSFGYEKEHYDLSMRVGEDRLFPALRELPDGARVVACGFSCRHQIAHAVGIRAVHWVETVRADGSM